MMTALALLTVGGVLGWWLGGVAERFAHRHLDRALRDGYRARRAREARAVEAARVGLRRAGLEAQHRPTGPGRGVRA
jgi:hypothetical protein